MATHKVGGEVDAFCTKCRMLLAHTILAMTGSKLARVRCNTCGGDHAYRAAPGSVRSTSTSPRAPREHKVVLGFDQRLQGRDRSAAKKYSPKVALAVDDLVDHPTFGLGIVTAIRGDKADVDFKASAKTLVHGRGEAAPTERPTYHPPPEPPSAPTDKPPAAEGDTATDAAEPGHPVTG